MERAQEKEGDKMSEYHKGQVNRILERYNAEHDTDPNESAPPVTWREERLACAILDLYDQLEAIKADVIELKLLAVQKT